MTRKPSLCVCGHTFDGHYRDARGYGCCLAMACSCCGPRVEEPPTERTMRAAEPIKPPPPPKPEHYKQFCVCNECIAYRHHHEIPLGWLPDSQAGVVERRFPGPGGDWTFSPHPPWCTCPDCARLGEIGSAFLENIGLSWLLGVDSYERRRVHAGGDDDAGCVIRTIPLSSDWFDASDAFRKAR